MPEQTLTAGRLAAALPCLLALALGAAPSPASASEDPARAAERAAAAVVREGNAFLKQGEYERAVESFTRALELDPRSAVASYNRGYAHLRLGRFDRAIEDCGRAIRLNARDPAAYLNRGRAYYGLKDYGRAVADYDQAVALNPRDPAAYGNRGLAHYALKRYDLAAADYGRGIELNPKDAGAYGNRGLAYYALKRLDMAIADYGRAIALNPKFATAHYNRALARLDAGQYAGAVQDLDKTLELSAGEGAALDRAELGFLRERAAGLMKEQSARDAASRASAQAARESAAAAAEAGQKGARLLKQGDFNGAAAELARAVELAPEDAGYRRLAAEALAALGGRSLREGSASDAVEALTRAAGLEPDDAGYARAAAAALMARSLELQQARETQAARQSDRQEAERLLEQAAGLDPGNAGIRNRMGTLQYYWARDYGAALRWFDEARSLDPAQSLNVHRGLALARLGRLAQAKAALSEAVRSPAKAEAAVQGDAAKALERIGLYEGHMAFAKRLETGGEPEKGLSEAHAAGELFNTAEARVMIEALEGKARKSRSELSERRNMAAAAGLAALLLAAAVVAVGRMLRGLRAAAGAPLAGGRGSAEAPGPGGPPLARAAAEGSETAGACGIGAVLGEYCLSDSRAAEAAASVKAGGGREAVRVFAGAPEAERDARALAFLRAGDYETAFAILRNGQARGAAGLAFKALRGVMASRRSGAAASEFERYRERLALAIAFSQAGLHRESVGMLGELVLSSAWKDEADAYLAAQVLAAAGVAGSVASAAGRERPAGFYAGYAEAFLLVGQAAAGVELMRLKPSLEGPDWPLVIGLHAANRSLEALDPDAVPEGRRVLLAEALIEDNKERGAMSVLERIARPRWAAREYSCALRSLQRQDRFEEAGAVYQEAAQRVTVEASPELRYYWAIFCERRGAFARAKAVYGELLGRTQGYKDAAVRLKNIEAIPAEELSRLSTILTFRDTGASGAAADAAEPPASAVIGGRYEILRPLGVGGMGIVYKARDRRDGRQVALKSLRSGAARDPKLARFVVEEARTMESLRHPGIVSMLETVDSDGVLHLVFEYVDGETLSELLACRGGMAPRLCVDILRRVVSALAHAHQKGVVHLDMKPANVMVDRQGNVKVMDFGIARRMGSDDHLSGKIVGTPAYMAPEQHQGRLDFQCDVYALGATAFEMLTGTLPFPAGKETAEVKLAEGYGRLPDSVPAGLAEFVRLCLKPDPGQRLQGIGSVALELDKLAHTARGS